MQISYLAHSRGFDGNFWDGSDGQQKRIFQTQTFTTHHRQATPKHWSFIFKENVVDVLGEGGIPAFVTR